MRYRNPAGLASAVGAATAPAGSGAEPQVDRAAVDKAFETLKSYDWGADRDLLNPIDDAVVATSGDAAGREALERRLLAALTSGISRAAVDFVCRKLRTVGTARSVPALAALLPDKDLSHMARYALERIPAPEAAQAMREALPRLSGALKAGVAGSLGVRRDGASVPGLAASLAERDPAVLRAAAHALGLIGTRDAAEALVGASATAPESVKPAIVDACLACADRLLAGGHKSQAVAIYRSLSRDDQPKHVRLAAARGLLAAKRD